jgi:hypothetical protein
MLPDDPVLRAGCSAPPAACSAGARPAWPARAAHPGGPPGDEGRAGRWAAAAARVARQRALVARLEAAGVGAEAVAELARRLLGEMERTLAMMARSRELIAGVPKRGRPEEAAAPAFAIAA